MEVIVVKKEARDPKVGPRYRKAECEGPPCDRIERRRSGGDKVSAATLDFR